MTNKELQKLGRRELLQLLLDQAKEADRLGKMLKENDEHLKQLEESYERLRDRLDKKDAQIHELKDALQAERDKREAELASRAAGGFGYPPQAAEPYPGRMQGRYPMAGGGAPVPEQNGGQSGFPAAGGYQPQPPDPYGGRYPPQAADPFPYQAPSQGQDPYSRQAPPQAAPYPYQGQPQQDPFPYQVPYQEGADPYAPGAEQPYQYQYPPARVERRRQGGAHGKLPLFFGWRHD